MSILTFGSVKSNVSFEELLKGGKSDVSFEDPLRLSKAPFNLEALPADVIVEMLHFLNSLDDLYNLTNVSAICYKLFEMYSVSIYEQVAKNYFGKDLWKDVSTLLVYQRNCGCGTILENSIAIQKDLQTPFKMCRSDVHQLIINHDFFDTCYNDTYLAPSLWGPPRLSAACMVKHFYDVWLLGLRFQYESIKGFASRKPLFENEQQNTFYSRVINTICLHSPFVGSYDSPLQEQSLATGIFTVWNIRSAQQSRRWIPLPLVITPNPLLYMKMVFRAAERPGWTIQDKAEFTIDYQLMSVDAMVEKYGLDKGLE